MKGKRRILLTGFADDLIDVMSELDSTSTDITLVTEEATDANVPKAVDIVIYVMSTDTSYSSQLHSIFVYVHDRVLAQREYLLAIEDVDLTKAAFPEVSHLPQVSISDLKNRLEHAG